MPFTLLPIPKEIVETGGTYTLDQNGKIAIATPFPANQLITAKRLQKALENSVNAKFQIAGGSLEAGIVLALDDEISEDQGYILEISEDGIEIVGTDDAGLFYGVCTLIQLLETEGSTLPCVTIEDYPDFPNRGVMLDISRDKVPTMETLYDLIDLLASWKINQVQLYTEHTFAYSNHKKVWENASPITAEEILDLDAYCLDRFIELVPNQNSFGHMHRWFEHEPYIKLAETETEVQTPWGGTLPPFSLSPAVPGSLALMKELAEELLPNFSSAQYNMGADETFDLGMGRTKEWVETKGKGRVYLDFLLQLYSIANENGRVMQFWGDIINQYPELVPEVPKDTIALEWGYDALHDFDHKSKLFADSGIPFYVCPGTSSWNTIAGRTDNCIGNIKNAIENGLKYGAIGVLNTDWGDRGHWQTLPVSYLGFAYGAALSWAYEENIEIDLPKVLDQFAFQDTANVMGKLAYDLGNAYKKAGIIVPNGSLLFSLFQSDMAELETRLTKFAEFVPGSAIDEHALELARNPGMLAEQLEETIDYINDVIKPVDSAQMEREDADLIKREFKQAAEMLKHGAKHGIAQIVPEYADKTGLNSELDAIEKEFREVWLARNRPGGLDDSTARFQTARNTYSQ